MITMKTICFLGTALLCSPVYGQAPPGIGRNAAGFVRTEIPAGKFTMLTIPFHGFNNGAPRTITDAIGDQLTGSDEVIGDSDFVIKFDPADQYYHVYWKANNGGNPQWFDAANPFSAATDTLSPGEGFWIVNNQTFAQSFYALGEVPDQVTAPSAVASFPRGIAQTGYAYPLEIAMNSTTLANDIPAGDLFSHLISRWDVAQEEYYTTYFYDTDGSFGGVGWHNFSSPEALTDHTLRAGEGFFFQRQYDTPESLVWTELKPYAWP